MKNPFVIDGKPYLVYIIEKNKEQKEQKKESKLQERIKELGKQLKNYHNQ